MAKSPARRLALVRAAAPAAEPPPVVVRIHGWKHAAAALMAAREFGRSVTLLSPPNASYAGGVGFWRAIDRRVAELFPDVRATLVVDCDGAAGHALAAFRVGLRAIVFEGNAAARQRLEDIAAAHGAAIVPRPAAALDLVHEKDPSRACRLALASDAATTGDDA